jgi:signal transduction histidine kinase
MQDPNDPETIGDNRVWALYEDHLGSIWVGTLDGVSVLDPLTGRFQRYQHDPDDPGSISSNSIFAFHEDAEGMMWIGTWGGGLNRFDPGSGRFIHYTIEDGLPNDTIYGIEADIQGNLWMSTNRGISKFDPSSGSFENFDVRDGLQDNEFNVGAHYRSPSGELFFGGIRGFNGFFPDEIQDNPIPPPVVITTFYKFNQPVQHDLSSGEPIILDYRDNFIAFEFAALDFNSPENNSYAYMLEGFDPDWIDAGNRRYVSYTNLDGGEYVFRVRGANSDGVWNLEGTSVDIVVHPPFWETTWFRLLAIASIALVGVGWYQWRVRSVEARSRELEQLVNQRTHEIEQRRKELDALYRADEQLFRHLEVEQVFHVLMDIAIEILDADKGSLWYWDERVNQLLLQACRGFDPESIEHMQTTTEGGSIVLTMQTGEPVLVADIQTHPHLGTWLRDAEGIHSFMSLPIKSEDRVYGVFNVGYLKPNGFGEEEQRKFIALTQRAAIAIEQARLQDQAQKTAVLEERQRIARDLHDAVTQTLFSANLISEVLPTLWEKDPEVGRSRLEVLHQLTRGALAEMRTLLYELRPSALEKADLAELLQQVADSSVGRARIPVELRVEGDCRLDNESKIAMYRVAQEALNNVIKHSAASQAKILVNCRNDLVELIVEDDGIGFNPSKVPEERFGLGIMQERAESISADFEVESSPGAGTRIRLSVKS